MRIPARARPRVAAAGFVILAGFGCWLLRADIRPTIDGDGIGYYAPLASLLFERNLDLRDEIVPQTNAALLRSIYLTPDGRLGDPFSVGPALLWAPAVAFVRLLPPIAALDTPPVQPWQVGHPAYAPRYARAVLWTDLVAVLAAGAVLSAVLSLEVGPLLGSLAVVATLFGTPAFAYVLFDPSYSHAASFAAVSLLVAALVYDRRRPLPLWLLGTSVGLASMMRWQDGVLALMFLPRVGSAVRERIDALSPPASKWQAAARVVLRFALPVVILLLPQMCFWNRIYGRPLLIPPGPVLLPFWRAAVAPLLLSTWNGAFVWSPVLLLGLLGPRLLPRRSWRWSTLAAVALSVYVCALLGDWWGGRSFGARRMVSLAPVAALGLALLFDRMRQHRVRLYPVAAAAVLAVAWNVNLIRCQRYGSIPPNPGDQRDYARRASENPAHATRYGLWDYPRLVSEVVEARHAAAGGLP